MQVQSANTMQGREINFFTPELKRANLQDWFWGKRVAVVGNAPVSENYSDEIEACDLVVRLNHAYNLPSGNVGKRTDILVFTPSHRWLTLPDDENGAKTIAPYRPRIISLECHEGLRWDKTRRVFNGSTFYRTHDPLNNIVNGFTLGGKLLATILHDCTNCEIKTFGFGTAESLTDYCNRYGVVHKGTLQHEIRTRADAFASFKYWKIKTTETPFHVVIPARKGSSLKDKNIRVFEGQTLLERCVKNCVEVFGEGKVSALTDSENYAQIARSAGAITPFILEQIDGARDVQETVSVWRDKTNFVGNVIVPLCTSPRTTKETLLKFKSLAEKKFLDGDCFITATRVKAKATAFLALKHGDVCEQIYPRDEMSTPRQALPDVYRFTGAMALFGTGQLREQPSFFHDARLRIVPVGEREALDIDDEKDLEEETITVPTVEEIVGEAES